MNGSGIASDKYTKLLPQVPAIVEFNGKKVPCDGTLRSATAKAESIRHEVWSGTKQPGTVEVYVLDEFGRKPEGAKPARRIWCGGKPTLQND